ncbi:SDR family oxidoreductase [Rhizobium brockwellii]|uniref:SDR family oxidoreductase n=1 Tax=Rhizobium brockwellii TaxID=3019932 RepID=UPI003F952E4A
MEDGVARIRPEERSQRLGEVAELAGTVRFLASDDSYSTTGSELIVDDGRT